MRRPAALTVALAAAAVAAPVAVADDTFPDLPRAPGPDTRLAVQAIADAARAVEHRWPRCRYPLGEHGMLTSGPAPAEVAAVVGVLRRPQTPREAAVAGGADDRMPLLGDVPLGSLRIVRTLADGTELRMFTTLPRPQPRRRPEVCRTRELRALRTRVRGVPARARRAALRLQRRIHAAERTVPGDAGQPAIFVAAVGPEPRDEVTETIGTSPQGLRSTGTFTVVHRRGHSLLVVMVPDGVARVEVVLARGRSPFTHRSYPTAPHLSGAAVDNVVAIPVNRTPDDVWVTRLTWRAPDGTPTRVEPFSSQRFVLFTRTS